MNDHHLASDLRTVLTRLIKKLRRKSISGQHLSLTERSTIGLLAQHGSLLPSELAAMEKITNQSMSQILSHLDKLGYINRIGLISDGRKVQISLSVKGAETLFNIRSERDEWLKQAIEETLTTAEQELLTKVIKPLTKLVDFD